MLITDDDIKLILKKYNGQIKTEDFTFKNKDGFWQLRNIKKYCFFFNKKTKLCSIYSFRPEGCRYYPLIYLVDIEICSLDTDCPRYNKFYHDWNDRMLITERLIKYLEKYKFIENQKKENKKKR